MAVDELEKKGYLVYRIVMGYTKNIHKRNSQKGGLYAFSLQEIRFVVLLLLDISDSVL